MKLLKFNEEVVFGSSGNVKEYALDGWSLGEDSPSFNWTEAIEARLGFNAQSTVSEISLKIVGFPFLADGKIESQVVWLHLNGMYCGIFEAKSGFSRVIPIRNAWLEPRGNVLTLTIPNAKSPEDLGLGADKRKLGLGIQSISLTMAQ